jgi:hypothetical protein
MASLPVYSKVRREDKYVCKCISILRQRQPPARYPKVNRIYPLTNVPPPRGSAHRHTPSQSTSNSEKEKCKIVNVREMT